MSEVYDSNAQRLARERLDAWRARPSADAADAAWEACGVARVDPPPALLVQCSRYRALVEALARWGLPGLDLDAPDGASDLDAAEARLRVRLPLAVRDLYRLLGARPDVRRQLFGAHRWVEPHELEWWGGRMTLCSRRGPELWLDVEELRVADPWSERGDDGPRDWFEEWVRSGDERQGELERAGRTPLRDVIVQVSDVSDPDEWSWWELESVVEPWLWVRTAEGLDDARAERLLAWQETSGTACRGVFLDDVRRLSPGVRGALLARFDWVWLERLDGWEEGWGVAAQELERLVLRLHALAGAIRLPRAKALVLDLREVSPAKLEEVLRQVEPESLELLVSDGIPVQALQTLADLLPTLRLRALVLPGEKIDGLQLDVLETLELDRLELGLWLLCPRDRTLRFLAAHPGRSVAVDPTGWPLHGCAWTACSGLWGIVLLAPLLVLSELGVDLVDVRYAWVVTSTVPLWVISVRKPVDLSDRSSVWFGLAATGCGVWWWAGVEPLRAWWWFLPWPLYLAMALSAARDSLLRRGWWP